MNKALILVILALFGLNAMSSQMFRPITSRPGNPPPFNPTTSRPVLYDDVEDNNLALDLRLPKDPNSYRIRFDEAQDDEMFRMEIPTGSTPPFNPTHIRPTRLDDFEDDNLASWSTGGSRVGGLSSTGPYINRPTGGRVFDDAEDNEMYRMENPTGSTPPFNPTHIRPTRFDDFEDDNLASWSTGQVGAWGSTGPYINRPTGGRVFDDAEDNEMYRMENPTGSTPPFNPTHIRPTRFDDFEDDNLASWNAGGSKVGSTGPYINRPTGGRVFDDAQDDEMFTQGDMGRMGGFLGSGNSGLIGGGGSVRGGGVAWGGAGQYAHNIGRNTQLIGGASVSHYPGSTVSINPHVGIKHSF